MKKLTKKEDQIMQIVWQMKAVFIRDIIEKLLEPKPHYNTVATLVKILVKKGFLQSELIGNTHQYSPAVELSDYREEDLKEVKKKYFDGSFSKMLSHFAKGESLSEKEIEELMELIKSKKESS